LCKEIAAWSQIKKNFDIPPDIKPSVEKRKRERKSDSKLEAMIKQTCTSLDILNQN
jgi:hypothetical protein